MVGPQINSQLFWGRNLFGVLITMAMGAPRETGVIKEQNIFLDYSKQIQIGCFGFQSWFFICFVSFCIYVTILLSSLSESAVGSLFTKYDRIIE